jgi:exopolyphosphatase / guanosine-5'-triphosphate,3'-diphosphate pyrophosphatase
VLVGCIDIGSNTTRLLVADVQEGNLREVLAERAFTRLGRELRQAHALSEEKIGEVAGIVLAQRRRAEAAGAQSLRVVATAAIRAAANRDELCRAVRDRAGTEVIVLDGDDEARLAFAGATRTLGEAPQGTVGVVDVGGGSTEIAIGTLAGGVTWSRSLVVGSGALADARLLGDPPTTGELDAARLDVAAAFGTLDVPEPDAAVAVGGSAASLRRLVGPVLDVLSIDAALDVLVSGPCADVAARYDLAPERVHLLPAGLLILAEASARLGRPLEIGCGGIREGICLELAQG